jgi:ERCC4-type nuclease
LNPAEKPVFALLPVKPLADSQPIIVVDTREQNPLPFLRLKTIPGTLISGDYSVAGLEELFSVERKSVPDLVGCCIGENRERFERELHRLRGFRFKRLLIVGTELEIRQAKYRSNVKPQSVLATIAAFEIRYDIPVTFSPTPQEAGRLVERWAFWFSREVLITANNLARPPE